MLEGPLLLPSGHVVFTPPREFDLSVASDVAAELRDLLELHRHIAVDCSHLDFLDSSGLGVLVAAHKHATDLGGAVVLCGANRRVERLLQLTGLEQLFVQYPDTTSVHSVAPAGAWESGSVEGVG
ncbi:MAG TPA: STAS domain-containing protein [Nocardioidaceae bacterium]|nr:STAS domain-containing protein [Nocardioidaceae bacterium]